MSKNSCTHEALVNSKYCRLTVCRDCGIIHFNLPCRISLQFEVAQFLEIADAFNNGARKVRALNTGLQNNDVDVIELKKILH